MFYNKLLIIAGVLYLVIKLCQSQDVEILLRIDPESYLNFEYDVTSRDIVCVSNDASKKVHQVDVMHSLFHYFPREFFKCVRGAKRMVIWTPELKDIEEDDFVGNELLEFELNELQMVELKPNMFRELKDLNYFHIQSDRVISINEQAFNGLNRLKFLSLDFSQIKQILPTIFAPLQSLETISLELLAVPTISRDTFLNNHRLNEVRLRGRFQNIDEEIFLEQYPKMYLSIDNNGMDLKFKMSAKIKYFYISNTPMRNINFEKAKLLTLAFNNVSLLSDLSMLQNQHNLIKFIAVDSDIEAINVTTFAGLENLAAIKIEKAGLQKIQCNAFKDNQRLTHLVLDVDNLDACTFGGVAQRLQFLGLRDQIFRAVLEQVKPIAPKLKYQNFKFNSIVWHENYLFFYGTDDPNM